METLSIFVAGIHGSGKSTLCKELAPRLKAQYVTASSLIGRAKPFGSGKAASEIFDNQTILASEIRRLSKAHPRILLDGHFCLLNQAGAIEALPLDVFCQLLITKVVVVTAGASLIHERLLARDGSTHELDVSAIESFQQAELEHAYTVSNALHLPLIEVDTSDDAVAVDAVVDFLTAGDR